MSQIKNYVILIFITVFFYFNTSAFGQNNCIELKKIIVGDHGVNFSDYMSGPELFPDHKSSGIFNNFWIKKDPIVSYCKEDIIEIRVKKGRTTAMAKNADVYEVVIRLKPYAAQQLEKTSAQFVYKYLATEINEEIVQIGQVIAPLTNPFVITFLDYELCSIIAKFNNVTNNLIVESRAQK